MMRAMLIYNPTAGQIWGQFRPETAKEYLEKHDWQVSIQPTQRIGGGTDLARLAVKEGYDAVLVAGGDGTLNEAIQSLAHSPVKLGILPVGTTNVLARELKISLNYNAALEYLPIAQPIQIDLGRVNLQYFLLMAGIGFDAQVVKEVNSQTKHLTGIAAFVPASFKALMQHTPTRVKLTMTDSKDRRRVIYRTVSQIMVSNAATYGTDFVISDQAKFDDGLLEVDLFKCKQLRDTVYTFFSILVGKHKEWSDMEHYSVTRLTVKAKNPCPIQVDGEPLSYTPAQIEVVPKALWVLKPKLMAE